MATKTKQPGFFDRLAKEGWQDTYTGIVLAIVIVIVAGLLIFNYFSTRSEQISDQGIQDQTQVQDEDKQADEDKQPNQGVVGGAISTPSQHTVSNGEFIVRLTVRAYGDPNLWPAVAKANNLTQPSSIDVGQTINLPAKDQLPQATVADLRTTDYGPITGASYTVDYGDTLASIAQRAYGDAGRWTQIDQENHLGRLPNNNPLIHAGNVLIIPR